MSNHEKWQLVVDLARLAQSIPPERRAASTVRRSVLADRQETLALARLWRKAQS